MTSITWTPGSSSSNSKELERNSDEIKERIRERVEAQQEALEEQYTVLFRRT